MKLIFEGSAGSSGPCYMFSNMQMKTLKHTHNYENCPNFQICDGRGGKKKGKKLHPIQFIFLLIVFPILQIKTEHGKIPSGLHQYDANRQRYLTKLWEYHIHPLISTYTICRSESGSITSSAVSTKEHSVEVIFIFMLWDSVIFHMQSNTILPFIS